ncbi:MAG: hypothetical protein O6940_01415 [Ignavibacteria bacterium]|nr:hypothetical protein [Ignavibacteria bacterium]
MNRKIKNFIILVIIFVLISSIGGYYIVSIQGEDLGIKEEKLNKLRADYASVELIKSKLLEIEERVLVVDSLLFTGKFNIPKDLSQSQFFDFVEYYSNDNSLSSYTNTEFKGQNIEFGINYYIYKVSGRMNYNNVYYLIYAIEQSKELKKVVQANLKSTNKVSKRGRVSYLVEFNLEVRVYFSSNDQFAAINFVENNLITKPIKDAYYPLIKVSIKPNKRNLPDIQEGALISLVPQGAFITDSDGNTELMQKGDKVYLGHLAEIDYENQTVTFVLNKGGLIEYQTMKLGENFRFKGK